MIRSVKLPNLPGANVPAGKDIAEDNVEVRSGGAKPIPVRRRCASLGSGEEI